MTFPLHSLGAQRGGGQLQRSRAFIAVSLVHVNSPCPTAKHSPSLCCLINHVIRTHNTSNAVKREGRGEGILGSCVVSFPWSPFFVPCPLADVFLSNALLIFLIMSSPPSWPSVLYCPLCLSASPLQLYTSMCWLLSLSPSVMALHACRPCCVPGRRTNLEMRKQLRIIHHAET